MSKKSDGSSLNLLLEEMMKIVWHYKCQELNGEIDSEYAGAQAARQLKQLMIGFKPEQITQLITIELTEERDAARMYCLRKINTFMQKINIMTEDELEAEIEKGVKKNS